MRYSKYSGRGNFFSLTNEVFLLGLSAGELSVYSFLKRCENRKTHQCWPSIRTIGEAVRMSENNKKAAKKAEKKLSRREWRIAVISAIIGGMVGLIPWICTLIGGGQ